MIHSTVSLGITLVGPLNGHKAQITPFRAQSSSISVNSTGPGETHPEHFTYRLPPAQRKGPSLQRGWILGRNPEKRERGLEALLWSPKKEDSTNDRSSSLKSPGVQGAGDGDAFVFEETRPSINPVSEAIRRHDECAEDVDVQRHFATKPGYVRGPRVDKKSFIRVYYLSALRVPASESWDLVYELKQHLLNWPRINNIGRIAGDDIDPDLETLLAASTERKTATRADSEVRAAAFEEPELNGKKARSKQSVRGRRKDDVVQSTVLELVTGDYEGDGARDSTFEDGFPRRKLEEKWIGPTRLLLLDEELAGMQVDALPLPVQAVCSKFRVTEESSTDANALVNCRLTIFYEYWSSDEVLWELLPEVARISVTFSRIGHVAELHLHPEQIQYRHLIAQVALDKNKPAVRSVVFRKILLQGSRYVVQVELLAGTTALVTTGWENGLPFRVNMGSVIWDARLSFERQRLIDQFCNTDVLCDVCAGVGLVAIPASLKVRRVYANDANPDAYTCLEINVVDNNVSGRIEISNKGVRSFLSSILDLERPLPITQLLMSYPVDAEQFLEIFYGAFDGATWPRRSLPRIHLYSICRDSEDEFEFSKRIAEILGISTLKVLTRRVAEEITGENMMYASFVLPDNFGFQN